MQKLAAGSDATALSPNVNSPSSFDSTKFNLVSGGTVYNISTLAPALRPWVRLPSRAFLRRKPSKWWLECYGVLPTTHAGQQLFPTGTTISSIAPDGLGMGTYAITMSAAATATGSPGYGGCGGELCIRWFSIHLDDHPRRPAYDDAGKHPREQ